MSFKATFLFGWVESPPVYMNYRLFFFLSAVSVFSAVTVKADEHWPRFRGINGSGVNHSHLVTTKLSQANQEWSTEINGVGHGSPVIWGDKIFLLSAVADEAAKTGGSHPAKKKGKKGKAPNLALPYRWVTLCLDRHTGDIIWQKTFDQRSFKGHRFNSAASSTAAANDEIVVFTWGTADQLSAVALDHDGNELWKSDLGSVSGGHGFGGSPILYDDVVILNNDQEKGGGNLLGLDANTGEIKWEVERKSQRISYSVPCIYKVAGRDVVVFVNWQHGFTAVDPLTGSVIAEKSVFNLETNERAISSPIVTKGMVIGTCGFTANPKHCVAMKLSGGDWQEVWRRESRINHIPSTIAVGDHTFLIEDSGIATCLNTMTGEESWMERVPGVEGSIFGSPVSDGKNLFFADENGNLHVIAARPEFEHVATNRLGELCRTTPVIVGGTIYIRTESMLSAWK